MATGTMVSGFNVGQDLDRFTPLSDAIMEDAWLGATRLIEEQGYEVSALLKQAGERVDAWREHAATASDATSIDDDSDET